MISHPAKRVFITVLWLLALAALIASYTGLYPAYFSPLEKLSDLYLPGSCLLIAALGMAPVSAAGFFDYSAGALILLIYAALPVALGSFPLPLVIGMLVGLAIVVALINAILISSVRLPYWIATIISGCALAIIAAYLLYHRASESLILPEFFFNRYFQFIAAGVAAIVVLLVYAYLAFTRIGLQTRALGDSYEKTHLLGMSHGVRVFFAHLFSSSAAILAAALSTALAQIMVELLFIDNLTLSAGLFNLMGNHFDDAIAAAILIALLFTSPLWCCTAVGRPGRKNITAILLVTVPVLLLLSLFTESTVNMYITAAVLFLLGIWGDTLKRRARTYSTRGAG